MAAFESANVSRYRSGTVLDPYESISLEPHVVINSQIMLDEIPNKLDSVVITDAALTTYTATTSTSPTSNQFYVHYTGESSGKITFNANKEGTTVYVTYSGKGLQYIASGRIWIEKTGEDVTLTLEDLISDVNETNDDAATAEAIRVIAESNRTTSESARVMAENARVVHDASFAFFGAYSGAVAYVPNNQVVYNSESYICVLNSTNNLPTSTTYWTKTAASGSMSSLASANGDISVASPTTAPTIMLNSGLGANQIVKRDAGGFIPDVTALQADVTQRVLNVRSAPYLADPTGTLDASAAIQAALNAGVKSIDGAGGIYKINTAITIPAGTVLRNITLHAGTAGMNMVLVNSKSTFNGKLVGTGTVSITERGIYPAADGVCDVNITRNSEFSNLTYGVHAQYLTTDIDAHIPKRWDINGYFHDIVGTTGASEGYAVLLSPAHSCTGDIKGFNIKRHLLYGSNGAKYNDFFLDGDTIFNVAVQFFSTAAQNETAYNRVRGTVRNISNPVTQTAQAIGCVCVQNANYNDIQLNVIGGGTADFAYSIEGGQVTGVALPKGNRFHDSIISGSFLGAEAIRFQNEDSTELHNCKINAYGTFAVISIRRNGTPDVPVHAAYITNNQINAQGQARKGIYDEVADCFSYIGINDIRNNGAGLRVDATTAGIKRRGFSREFYGESVLSTGANTYAGVVVTFPEALASPKVFTNIVSQSVSSVKSIAYASSPSTTQFNLNTYNDHSVTQNITVDWRATGD